MAMCSYWQLWVLFRTGKTRMDNPLLTDDDGPVYHLRRWYEQFFVDVADMNSGGGALDVRRSIGFGSGSWSRRRVGDHLGHPYPFAAPAATRTGGSSARRLAITASTRARPRARS
jgi:3-ketosteroid 9alpha-hydroxylase-like protein